MKILEFGEVSEVYAISISTSIDDFWPVEKKIVFYYTTKGSFGLGVADLVNAEIIDSCLGPDFNIHLFDDKTGLMILWNHFEDIDHLARLIDLNIETVAAFEKARAVREKEMSAQTENRLKIALSLAKGKA